MRTSLIAILVLLITAVACPASETAPPKDEELLRLMLTSFLASNDLEKAYITAKWGAEYFPDSLFWRKNLGDISLWTNRQEEALENYYMAYRIGKDEKISELLLSLSMSLMKYDIAKPIITEKILNGDMSRLKDFIYLYESLGELQEAADILWKVYRAQPSGIVLSEIANIKVNYGDVEDALKILRMMEKEFGLGVSEALTYARLLYVLKDFKGSFEILMKVAKKAKDADEEFWRTVSDLGWALGEYEKAVGGSEVLYRMGRAGENDYQRIITFYKDRNPAYAMEKALEGWRKHNSPFFLFLFLEIAYKNKRWDVIVDFFKGERRELVYKEQFFMNVYAGALKASGRTIDVIKLYRDIIEKTEDPKLIADYLWLLLEMEMKYEIGHVLKKWKGPAWKNEILWLPYAASFSYLTDTQSALPYIEKLVKKHKDDIYILAVYGDILEMAGRLQEASGIRSKAWKLMTTMKKERLEILNDPVFLQNYLRLAVHFVGPREFQKLMDAASNVIEQGVLRGIEYAYRLRENQHDRVICLITRYEDAAPWMLLNIALNQDDRHAQSYIVNKHVETLPIRDRVEAFIRTGDIPSAKKWAFKGLEENRDDYLLYKQFRDLYLEYSDRLSVISESVLRNDLDIIRNIVNFKKMINNRLSIEAGIEMRKQNSDNDNVFINVPSMDKELSLKINYKLKDGYLIFRNGYRKGMDDVWPFGIEYSAYLKDRVSMNLSYDHNHRAEETLYLLLGGVKDSFYGGLNYAINNRAFVSASLNYDLFYSQDRKKLGEGWFSNIESQYKLKIGYPDFTFRSYISKGIYNSKEGDKGTVGRLSPLTDITDLKVLPPDFYQIGLGFLFGFEQKLSYTRAFRPYLSSEIFFNEKTNLGYSLGIGLGGTVFKGDNLSLGIILSRGSKGIDESLMNFYLNYLRWF